MQPVITLVAAIVAVAFLILIAMVLRGGRGHHFDVEAYQTRWLKIENGLLKSDPRSYSLAVLEADKLLDQAMREIDVVSKTMGERLKKNGDRFSELNKVWFAHKIRNQIAHEQDFEVDYSTSRHALSAFKQALKDLGAI